MRDVLTRARERLMVAETMRNLRPILGTCLRQLDVLHRGTPESRPCKNPRE